MPLLTKMSERLNEMYSSGNIEAANFAEGDDLRTVFSAMGVAVNDAERDWLDTWPPAIQDTMLSVLRHAATAKPRVPLIISWRPDYDYSISVWDARSTVNSIRGITVQITSPYPSS